LIDYVANIEKSTPKKKRFLKKSMDDLTWGTPAILPAAAKKL
jgi:hypothetical protein